MGALTIDQLAERTGLTVRNVRAYQAKHLLHCSDAARARRLYDDRTSNASS